MEMYTAYRAGRGRRSRGNNNNSNNNNGNVAAVVVVEDPSINWYNGELGFFDYYLIPLAKKLEECGVFGVSSDEYLDYAIANRNEWERKGHDIVKVIFVVFLKECFEVLAVSANGVCFPQ